MAQSSSKQQDNIDLMMNEIIHSLEVIKKQLPNGELKAIQERIERIDATQEDMKEDLRSIKRQLLDPEDGVVVRVNKNTAFRKKAEEEEKDYDKLMDEHREIMSFKDTVTKVLWVIFTAIVGIIAAMIFGVK